MLHINIPLLVLALCWGLIYHTSTHPALKRSMDLLATLYIGWLVLSNPLALAMTLLLLAPCALLLLLVWAPRCTTLALVLGSAILGMQVPEGWPQVVCFFGLCLSGGLGLVLIESS